MRWSVQWLVTGVWMGHHRDGLRRPHNTLARNQARDRRIHTIYSKGPWPECSHVEPCESLPLRWEAALGPGCGWALAALALTGLLASVSLRLCLYLGVGRGTLAPRRGPDGRRVQPSHTQGYNTPSLGFPFRVSVFRPPSSPSLFDFRSSTLRARARLRA